MSYFWHIGWILVRIYNVYEPKYVLVGESQGDTSFCASLIIAFVAILGLQIAVKMVHFTKGALTN